MTLYILNFLYHTTSIQYLVHCKLSTWPATLQLLQCLALKLLMHTHFPFPSKSLLLYTYHKKPQLSMAKINWQCNSMVEYYYIFFWKRCRKQNNCTCTTGTVLCSKISYLKQQFKLLTKAELSADWIVKQFIG